jgi:hypothetical protein
VLFFVGIPTALASLGVNEQSERLAELREADPAAYLIELKEEDEQKWLSELAVLDPEQHEAEIVRLEQVRAEEEARQQEDRAQREAEADARQAEAAVRRAEEQATKVEDHLDQLDRELASLPGASASEYTESIDQINVALILIGAWTLLYEEGADLPLDEEGQQKRQRFRELLVQKQAEMLPILRDAYGPAMRSQLWIADGSARTFGNGYRTVEFVSAAFARNANIQETHSQIQENLIMLRFTRVQYKWFQEASEYSYYTLEPPRDTDLAMWEAGARFRIVP